MQIGSAVVYRSAIGNCVPFQYSRQAEISNRAAGLLRQLIMNCTDSMSECAALVEFMGVKQPIAPLCLFLKISPMLLANFQ